MDDGPSIQSGDKLLYKKGQHEALFTVARVLNREYVGVLSIGKLVDIVEYDPVSRTGKGRPQLRIYNIRIPKHQVHNDLSNGRVTHQPRAT